MILFHGRWRRRTALLALGALDEAKAARVRAHLGTCAACARDLAESRAALELVSADPVHGAEPPIPLGALVARVRARLDEAPARERAWRPLLAGAGLLAAVVLAAVLGRSWRPPAPPTASPEEASVGAPPSEAGPIADSAEAMRRIESTLERERAAHYLSDAQDVLVTVVSAPQRCARRRNAVEVGPEAERSRELLARRRLFVETDAPSTVVARDVLDDVEEMLREVAALDACARPQDLEAIRGEIARRHLLMKIDLVTRELQG
ncbi:MAG TPA: zf-HC2 domain-containing protein [Vicinamibacteria bacterium]